MMFPKPEKVEKKPKPIPRSKPKKESFIDYSGMAFAKPSEVKKVSKPIGSGRTARRSLPSINSDTGTCLLCGCGLHGGREVHEIYFGKKYRTLSIKYGLTVDLCPQCHRVNENSPHKNRVVDLVLKEFGQRWFIEKYPDLDFCNIFGRNYLGVSNEVYAQNAKRYLCTNDRYI